MTYSSRQINTPLRSSAPRRRSYGGCITAFIVLWLVTTIAGLAMLYFAIAGLLDGNVTTWDVWFAVIVAILIL